MNIANMPSRRLLFRLHCVSQQFLLRNSAQQDALPHSTQLFSAGDFYRATRDIRHVVVPTELPQFLSETPALADSVHHVPPLLIRFLHPRHSDIYTSKKNAAGGEERLGGA